jgi:hypothetical protein
MKFADGRLGYMTGEYAEHQNITAVKWLCETNKTKSVAFSPQSMSTERPPLVCEVSAEFSSWSGVNCSAQRIRTAVNFGFRDWKFTLLVS